MTARAEIDVDPRARVILVLVVTSLLAASCGSRAHATQKPAPGKAPSNSVAAGAPVPGVPPSGNIYDHTAPADLSPAVQGVPSRVYVPNTESNSIDVIDPATFAVVAHFAVGLQPQHVSPAWDLKMLYVDNDKGNSLTPIDPQTGTAGAPIPVTDPYNLYFTPDGSKAIVVAEALMRLDFRDPHTWQLLTSVPVPHPGIDHMDFSADGRYLLASCEFSGYVVRIDLDQMRVTGELKVGGSPVDVKLSPDGTVFYVANQKRNGVSVIDPTSMKEIAFIDTGKGAHGLYPSRDAKSMFVSNRIAGSISVVDFATRKVTDTWTIGGSPDMGGVSTDGSQLWLSGRYNRHVYVIDTHTGKLLHVIPVGSGPHGICLFPQPGRFSMGHTGIYR